MRKAILKFLVCFIAVFGALIMKSYAGNLPVYNLKVGLDLADGIVSGVALIEVPAGINLRLKTGGLQVDGLFVNGRRYDIAGNKWNLFEESKEAKVIEVRYSLKTGVTDSPDGQPESIITPSGAVLLAGWYPEPGGFSRYSLTVTVPDWLEVISEAQARQVYSDEKGKRIIFDAPFPMKGITLVAGRYEKKEEEYNGVLLDTYFFPEDIGLADEYLEYSRRYINLYEPLFGRFPYRRFSIVENRYQTGYSFPTYTLLGSKVIRLPFIVRTSLGHEILHQWFGNYVYVDYEKGNWSEGLTTYLADHWYEHLAGRGAEYRKKIMVDYMNYVNTGNEFSLREFQSRSGLASRAIGYGKAAMFFHMLRKEIGDAAFFNALRNIISGFKFKDASWDDLVDAFSSASGRDLGDYAREWLDRKGLPDIGIENSEVIFRKGKYLLRFEIVQRGEVYKLRLPVKVISGRKETGFIIPVDSKHTYFEKKLDERPERFIVDGEYDVMRRLTGREVPPVISAFSGDRDSIVVIPGRYRELFGDAVGFLEKKGYKVKDEKEVGMDDIRENSLLLFSTDNVIYRRLFAGTPLPGGGLVLKVNRNPLNSDKVVVVVDAKDRGEVSQAFGKLFRYGNYSLLVFDNGKNVRKETGKSDSGIITDLTVRAGVVETGGLDSLSRLVENIKDRRVVYVGEVHTEYSHHVMQYEIIKRLYDADGKVIVGMEMFQRPFQKYLDMYIKGEISEAEMLKKTEYFKRWTYDYNLYRDILQFARSRKIKVVALNVRKELLEKVSAGGLESLTEEELKEVPQDMDMTNEVYRTHLRQIYGRHSKKTRKDFDTFYQSQLLWDETMAETTAETLEAYPDYQVVVLAGDGHVQYSWGIPDRVSRHIKVPSAVIINYGGEEIDRKLADFVLFPSYIETPESPRLMVFLKDSDEGVSVEKVMESGPAGRAGIQEGDIITALDGLTVKDIQDIKIFLVGRNRGDRIRVRLLRKYFIFGSEKLEVEVDL